MLSVKAIREKLDFFRGHVLVTIVIMSCIGGVVFILLSFLID
jgi:hypothetical protein